MHYKFLCTWLEGRFWMSFPSAATPRMAKKDFTPSYWGREHTHNTMFGLVRLKLNSALLPKTMSQQPALPHVSRFPSSKNHPRNRLNDFNFSLFTGAQSYNYLTPGLDSHLGKSTYPRLPHRWDNSDSDGVLGCILTLKMKPSPVTLIDRKKRQVSVKPPLNCSRIKQ